MASCPITSWEIDGETMETVSDFVFLGSKITADGECSHEIKRRLLLGRKVMTNLDSIFKSRDITLPTKVHLVKGMVFPVVMCGCESWTVKKAEHWRIDAFEVWCWRRLLRVPWTARRSNQSILKGISPGCSLEGLMLKLKVQYFSLEKTLMLRKIEAGRRRGRQRMRWLDDITDSMDMVWVDSRSWWWTGRPGVLRYMGSQRVRHDWATELNWIQTLNIYTCIIYIYTQTLYKHTHIYIHYIYTHAHTSVYSQYIYTHIYTHYIVHTHIYIHTLYIHTQIYLYTHFIYTLLLFSHSVMSHPATPWTAARQGGVHHRLLALTQSHVC